MALQLGGKALIAVSLSEEGLLALRAHGNESANWPRYERFRVFNIATV